MDLLSRLRRRRAHGASAGAAALADSPTTLDVLLSGRPAIRVYGDRDGLPAKAVTALALDREGYLWVGTQDGAARYDGRVWRTVNMPDRARSNLVRTIAADEDGSVWFGTWGGGVARFTADVWTVLDPSCLPSDKVRSLLITSDGAGARELWVASSGGLALSPLPEADRWTVFDAPGGPPGHAAVSLARGRTPDGKAVVWAGGGPLVARFGRDEGGTWRLVESLDVPGGKPVWGLAEDSEGALWVGTIGGGLARLAQGEWDVFGPSDGLPSDIVTSVLESRLGGTRTIWAGTYTAGLARYEQRRWSVVGASSAGNGGLPNNQVDCLIETANEGGAGALWVGTIAGLARFERGQWVAFDTSTGLPNDGVMAFLETDTPPTLWIGTYGGLARFRSGAWTVFDTSSSGLPNNHVNALCATVESDGRTVLWIGTAGGVARLVEGEEPEWTVFDTSSTEGGLPSAFVICLYASTDDEGGPVVWAGTRAGLARHHRGRWTAPGASLGGLPNDEVWCVGETLAPDGARTLWVGTNGGGLASCTLEPGARWTVFDASSGGLPNDSVECIFESRGADGSRTLWVGTSGGLVRRDLDDDSSPWLLLDDSTRPALPNNCVYQVREDGSGRIYACTNRGVARLTRRLPTADDPAPFDVETYTTESGLPSMECNQGASMVDRAGRVWVGTAGGGAVFDPSREIVDRTPKRLVIERAVVAPGGRTVRAGDSLAHDEGNIELEYSLLSYFREAETRYRSQLVGLEREPTPWSSDARRTYTNLGRGEYCFRVWGRDWAGNVSGPVELSLRVRPAPWKTWWAYLAYAGAAGGAAFAAVRYRFERLEKQRRELEETVAERTMALAESESRTRHQAEVLASTVEQLQASERRAHESERAAVEASSAKSVFLANMSHELRTPLNAVLGFARMVEREGGLTPSQAEHLAIVRQSGEHLLGLINDVLSLAKIEAGKLTLGPQAFDFDRTVGAVAAMVHERAQTKGLALSVEIDGLPPGPVFGDEGKLRQVLLNLLGNAVKFTDDGSVALRSHWRETAPGRGRAAFEVSDTGCGISDEERGKLFEAFAQTERGRRSADGTGLGLAISRQIVRLMGGDIRVESARGSGSTFRFEVDLPLAAGTAARIRRFVRELAPGQRPLRVLVVDDVDENRILLARLLAAVGCDVREARDGVEAIEGWERWQPQAIFMDMRMPVVDGREATREIRRREAADPSARLACRIVALTSSALDDERQAILASGCDDFIAKPFFEETIFEKLSQHTGVRWLYDDSRAKGKGPISLERGSVARRLASMAPETRRELERACVLNDDELALSAIATIGLEDPQLAGELRRMVSAFEFEEVLALARAY